MILDTSTVIQRVSSQSYPIVFAILAVLITVFSYWINEDRCYPGFKVIGMEKGEWGYAKAKKRYVENAVKIMKQGAEDVSIRNLLISLKKAKISSQWNLLTTS